MEPTSKPDSEIALSGGNVNAGVVRVGATVRRQLTPASTAVHALLRHLEAEGFAGSPRLRGIDAEGREILTFFPGETGIPPAIWQHDAPLVAVATLLRQYHDATVAFVPPVSAHWAYTYPDRTRHEVICHNDFAPYNMVFNDGIPYAVIDFDLAGPGPRLRDIAYAGVSDGALVVQQCRPAAFCRGRFRGRQPALSLVLRDLWHLHHPRPLCDDWRRLAVMGSEVDVRRMVGADAAANLKREGHLAHWQREAQAFQRIRPQLERTLVT